MRLECRKVITMAPLTVRLKRRSKPNCFVLRCNPCGEKISRWCTMA